MKFLNHIKLAVYVGLVTGIIHGTLDIVGRIAYRSFEWFEFYQTLIMSSYVFVIFFLIIALILGLLNKLTGLKLTKKSLLIFYTVTPVSILLFFYGDFFINFILIRLISGFDQIKFWISLLLVISVILIYILLLTKGKNLVLHILSYFQRKKIKSLFNNYKFGIIVFVIIALLLDIVLLNYIPSYTPNKELKEFPNIIFIVMDTLRADHVSYYGYHLNTTPNIDNIAKDSVVFDNAISSSPWSLPSHASFFTGKYTSSHGTTRANPYLNEDEITLAEVLKEKGYNTVGFVGGSYIKKTYGIGQGFNTYIDRIDFFEYILTFNDLNIMNIISNNFPNAYKIFGSDGEKTSEELNKDIFKWLDKNKAQPFFMFINYFDAHDPYNLGKEFRDKFTNKTGKDLSSDGSYLYMFDRSDEVPQEEIDYMIELYDTEIFFLDYNFGKFIDKLDQLGIKDNTIIIITSDHGEEFYEHGSFVHGRTLYEEVIHVPLIFYYPKEFQSKRIDKRVEIIGIFPTILDILDIEIPEDVDATSLLPLINNVPGYDKEFAKSELFGRKRHKGISDLFDIDLRQESISNNDWKLIEIKPENEILNSSLFNLRTDPEEKNNLYDKFIDKRNEMKKLIVDDVGEDKT
ncbi:MAG: sulfatase [Nanoarchaeota archaeon]|nr:sulfatase [Nanoarchaeota archaeon]